MRYRAHSSPGIIYMYNIWLSVRGVNFSPFLQLPTPDGVCGRSVSTC